MKISPKVIIGAVTALALILGLWLVIASNSDELPEDSTDTTNQTADETPVDESAESEDEATKPEDKKLDEIQQSDVVSPPDAGSVEPFITNASVTAGKLTARGYVPGIIEDGGDCLFKLKNNSGAVVKQVTTEGFVDVSKTTCTPGTMTVSSLASGNYKLTLEYASDKYTGVSQSFEVKL